MAGWWQLKEYIYIYSSLTWGNDPIRRAYFSDGLVQPTTRNLMQMYGSFEGFPLFLVPSLGWLYNDPP